MSLVRYLINTSLIVYFPRSPFVLIRTELCSKFLGVMEMGGGWKVSLTPLKNYVVPSPHPLRLALYRSVISQEFQPVPPSFTYIIV